MSSDFPRDRGSASVLMLAVGLTLAVAGLLVAAVGAGLVARRQAQVAADLGALAGAARAIEGEAVACARATALVRRNDARLTHCRLSGWDLTVTAEVDPAPAVSLPWAGSATARAGPIRGRRVTSLAGAGGARAVVGSGAIASGDRGNRDGQGHRLVSGVGGRGRAGRRHSGWSAVGEEGRVRGAGALG